MNIRKRHLYMIGALIAVGIFVAAVVVIVVLIGSVHYLTTAPSIEFTDNDTPVERIQKTEAWLQSLHDNDDFNGAVLIVGDGEIMLSQCWGYSDASKKVKLTPQTSMRLASVSKQFTAAAILVLAQQQKLQLDDPVANHLKDFPFQDVTIRHLLNMTSAIPDCYMDQAEQYRKELNDYLTTTDVARLLAKYPPPRKSKVNEGYQYSNTSYVLLAGVVETVSGLSFEEFMADELFKPLGMKHSRVWNLASEEKTFEGKAKTFVGATDQVPEFIDGVAGDGAVFCSLEDFVIWDRFWRGNDLVGADLIDQAFIEPTLLDGSTSDYGFGWVIEENGHWHNGRWLGAATYTFQDDRFFVAILDNSGSLIIDSMGQEIRRAIER